MESKTTKNAAGSTQTVGAKKQYQRPQVQVFGKLHLVTQGTGGTDGDGALGMTRRGNAASEPSIKQNIVQVGTHPLGIGLYLFDYKPEFRDTWGHGRQFGVMADEVERVMPDAVCVHPDGYRTVDYAKLGIGRTIQ